VVGGVLVALIGLRYQFVVGGLLMAGAAIPLVFLVRETDRRHEPSRRMSLGKLIRTMSPSQMRTLGLLLTLVAVAQVLNFTLTQFLGLRVVETVGANANLIIGLTFAVFGGCTALGALTYASIVTRVGYKPVAAWSMGLFGLGMVGVAISRQPALIVAAAAGMGIAFGASFPVLNTMVGLESPEPVRATVFGVGNSLVGLGFVIVPALAGLVASAVSVSAALLCLAVGAGLCTVALLLFSHEPQQVS
jgi:MFS family permease